MKIRYLLPLLVFTLHGMQEPSAPTAPPNSPSIISLPPALGLLASDETLEFIEAMECPGCKIKDKLIFGLQGQVDYLTQYVQNDPRIQRGE